MTHRLDAPSFAMILLLASLGSIAPAVAEDSVAGLSSPAPDTLSIQECVERARQLSPVVQAAMLDLRAARYDSAAAVRVRSPALSVFARATIAPEGFYDPAFTNLGEYEMKLGVSWPIVGPRAARRARALALNDVQAAATERDRLALEAGLRAAELAVELLRLRDEERSQADALAWLEDLSTLLASQVRAGSAHPSDSVRVGLELDDVRATLDQMQAASAAAQRELAQITGLEESGKLTIREPGPDGDHQPAEADSLRLLSRLALLPDVQSARTAEERALLEAERSRARNGWQTEIGADMGLAGTNLTTAVPPELEATNPDATFADRLQRDLGASLSFDVRHPIYDATHAPEVAARETAATAAGVRGRAQRSIQDRLSRDLIDRWSVAWRQLQTFQRSTVRAEENLLRVKSLYAAGSTGILDLLDARRALDDARQRLVEARAETRIVRLEVETRP
jgi:outer membrane protein TolC